MKSHEMTLIPTAEEKSVQPIEYIQDMNATPTLDKVVVYEKSYKEFVKDIQNRWRPEDKLNASSVECQEMLRTLETLIETTVIAYNDVSLEKLNGDKYDYEEIRRAMIDSLSNAVGTYFDRVDTYESAEKVVDKIITIQDQGHALDVLKRVTPFFNRMLHSGIYGVGVEPISNQEFRRLKQFVDEKNLWEIFYKDQDALKGFVKYMLNNPAVLIEN